MEKRFVGFLLASMLVLLTYTAVMQRLVPPPKPVAEQQLAEEAGGGGEAEGPPVDEPPAGAVPPDEEGQVAADRQPAADTEDAEVNAGDLDDAVVEARDAVAEARDKAKPQAPVRNVEPAEQKFSLGSLDPDGAYRILVTLTNHGAAVERVELNNSKYRDLENKSGFLGSLSLLDDVGGCRVKVVGNGTPAALAKSASGGLTGLRGPLIKTKDDGETQIAAPGDLITAIDGQPISERRDFQRILKQTRPGQEIEVSVTRSEEDGRTRPLTFVATLRRQPLSVLEPEPTFASEEDPAHPASFLLTLDRIGDAKTRFGEDEIVGLSSLRDSNWRAYPIESGGKDYGPGVEFRRLLTRQELESIGVEGQLEVVKRYRIAKVVAAEDEPSPSVDEAAAYRLSLEIAIHNLGDKEEWVGYQLDGPTGITTEGWWYSYKVHPSKFVAAGARDVAWRAEGGKHRLFVGSQIAKQAEKEEDSPDVPLFDANEPESLRYAGCDAQYFAAMLLPDPGEGGKKNYVFDAGFALAVGPLDERLKTTDVTFRLKSQRFNIPPNDALRQQFLVFVGPKDSEILKHYGLEETIVFGWFGWVSRPMLWLLHQLYWLTGSFSYGLAVIILTIMVRGCMFPLGRKMALNSQKMQELAPEMKHIAEKYKNDLEKRTQAQRELYAKHKFNPLSGCGVMFIQMPVFLGLYRGLSCDIALRQAPLIPGLSWCSNLAGPDQFWHWEGVVPAMISSSKGIFGLGPYLNILPLITVVLFLAQHKLFSPPPQDEQQQMQHTIMKFMMVFMGVLFHKVAAGLCLYIIASTLWGLGERLILPKSQAARPDAGGGGGDGGTSSPKPTPTNGASRANGARAAAKQKKKKQKRR